MKGAFGWGPSGYICMFGGFRVCFESWEEPAFFLEPIIQLKTCGFMFYFTLLVQMVQIQWLKLEFGN